MLEMLTAQQWAALGARWLERTIDRYPAETATFLRTQQDQFANPVGAVLREATGTILGCLLGERPAGELVPALDRIIRIRAVQDMPASQAVAFILDLKELVREELAAEPRSRSAGREPQRLDRQVDDFDRQVDVLDQKVDELLLTAFDVYVRCRDEISRIRVQEIKARSLDRMERLNEWRARRYSASKQGPESTQAPEPCEEESDDVAT